MIRFFDPAAKSCLFARIPYFSHYTSNRVDAYVCASEKSARGKDETIVRVLHVTSEWKNTHLKDYLLSSQNQVEGTWGILRGFVQTIDIGTIDEGECFFSQDLLLLGSYDEATAFHDYSFDRRVLCAHETPSLKDHYIAKIIHLDDD